MLERVAALREQKVIRQISAIFDSRRLGYRGMLVAARTPAERQDAAAAVFSSHPGVSHNYLREHELNLWFTLTVSPRSQLGLDRTVELLGELAEVDVIRPMPALRFFKIGVDLDVKGDRDPAAKLVKAQAGAQGAAAGGADRPRSRRDPRAAARPRRRARAVRRAGRPVPASRPAELLAHGHSFLETGQMRRYAAVLAHRNAGFVQNGMGVWRVPEERLDECGQAMAAFRGVSHCYQRPTYPGLALQPLLDDARPHEGRLRGRAGRGRSRDRPRRLLGAVLHQGVQEDARLVFHAGGSGVGAGARPALGLITLVARLGLVAGLALLVALEPLLDPRERGLDLAQREARGRQLARQELGLGLRALVDEAILLGAQRGRARPGGSAPAGSAARRRRPASRTRG